MHSNKKEEGGGGGWEGGKERERNSVGLRTSRCNLDYFYNTKKELITICTNIKKASPRAVRKFV